MGANRVAMSRAAPLIITGRSGRLDRSRGNKVQPASIPNARGNSDLEGHAKAHI
jgi:hypothetical protein